MHGGTMSADEGGPDGGADRFLRSMSLLLISLFAGATLSAQDQSHHSDSIDWRLGVTFLLGPSTHSIDLDIYQGSSGCGTFTEGIVIRPEVRFYFERPLFEAVGIPVDLYTALSWQDRSIALSERFSAPGRTRSGEDRTIVTRHRYEASIVGLGALLGLVAEPIPGIRLGAATSLHFVADGESRQYEEIVSPLGATFTETELTRRPVDRNGELIYRSFVPGLSLSGGIRVPISLDFGLQPEIGVDFDLLPIEESYAWRTTTYRLGISIFREKINRSDQPDQAIAPPTIAVKEPTTPPAPNFPDDTVVLVDTKVPYLEARIVAFGIDSTGKKYPEPIIEITEAPTTETIPLIPYIFFDSGSALIPERYHLFEDRVSTSDFRLDSIVDLHPMLVHHHLLNIIGDRLRQRPDVSMTIVGTLSRDEISPDLARARADSLRAYFVEVWEINPRRLRVTAGEAQNRSSEGTPEGRAENRRAEFRFDGEALLSPVMIERLARIASPPAITFEKEVYADTTLSSLVVLVMQGEKELLRFVEGESASGPSSRFWPLSDLRVNRDLTPIRYRFEVTDVTGQVAVDEGEFRVLERVTRSDEVQIEINEYLLAGFVYNSAALSPAHISAIYEIAREAGESAWIEIAGFTDEVGAEQTNRRLALDRAENVAARLRMARQELGFDSAVDIVISGSGASDASEFNNDLPEGRIFSRMVRVTIHRSTE